MTSKIQGFTPDHVALIPQYREKWRTIAHSTQRIDCRQATLAVRAVYAAIDQPHPEVIFCTSPYVVPKILRNILRRPLGRRMKWMMAGRPSEQLLMQLKQELGNPLHKQFGQLRRQIEQELKDQLQPVTQRQLEKTLWRSLEEPPYTNQLWDQLERTELVDHWPHFRECINPEFWVCDAALLDFCVSVLNCTLRHSSAFLAMIEPCGWLFPYEKICIVCDRPIHLAFDSRHRLHAEGEPAVQFADGFSVYAYQGICLPEREDNHFRQRFSVNRRG